MSIRYVERAPTEIRYTPAKDDIASRLQPEHVERIAEIFHTPLTGSYVWDYASADRKIKRLYQLGKELNWNGEKDLDWSLTMPRNEAPVLTEMNPLREYPGFVALTEEQKVEYSWHDQSWLLSQFLHGEQGALLVSSQLVSCAPTYDAKLYAASQTFDEARHVEVFTRYVTEKVGMMYPVNRHLKMLMDKVLTDPRWDLKFIGMQIVIEGLALAAFNTMALVSKDPLLQKLIEYVKRDEARHVAFGVTYLEEFVKTLPQEEIEARALFAYEACVVMRERIIGTDVHAQWGWDVEKTREYILSSEVMAHFRKLLFTRIVPNLKKIGLLTDKVRPLYAEMDVLEYEDLVDDGVITWGSEAAE
jgi:hypothetical protein